MFRQVVVSAGGLAAVPVVVSKVYAADDSPKSKQSKRIRACDLPLYGQPELPEIEIVEEKMTPFRENVSSFRKFVWQYMDQMQGGVDVVNRKWEVSKAHTQDLITYLKEDPGALPRAGIITVAGLGGIVAGYKGGAIRKTFYASSAMVAAGSVCYPQQAVDITVRGFNKTVAKVNDVWDESRGIKKSAEKEQEKQQKEPEVKAETPATEKKSEAPAKDVKKTAQAADSKTKVDESKKDYGQSKKEDQDLYTTRTNK